jgi:hypothetical protein
MASALVNIGPMSMPSLRVPLPRPPLSSDMDSDIVPIDMSSLPELTPPPLSGRETPPPRSSADSLPSSAAPVSTSNRTFEAAIVDDPRSEEGKPSRRGRWLLAALLLAAGGVGVWLMNGGKLPLPTTSHESAAPAHAAPEVETGAPNAADEASQAPEEGVEESREAVASATASADEPQSEPSGEEAAPKPPNASIAPPRRRGTPAPPPQTPPSPAPVAKPGPASDPFAERL